MRRRNFLSCRIPFQTLPCHPPVPHSGRNRYVSIGAISRPIMSRLPVMASLGLAPALKGHGFSRAVLSFPYDGFSRRGYSRFAPEFEVPLGLKPISIHTALGTPEGVPFQTHPALGAPEGVPFQIHPALGTPEGVPFQRSRSILTARLNSCLSNLQTRNHQRRCLILIATAAVVSRH